LINHGLPFVTERYAAWQEENSEILRQILWNNPQFFPQEWAQKMQGIVDIKMEAFSSRL
jgi:hypothetical protein